MTHSEICPVCSGKGKLEDKICHGCEGKGWIVIPCNELWPIQRWHPVYPTEPYPYWLHDPQVNWTEYWTP